MDRFETFEDFTERENAEFRDQIRRDLGDELAGRETGRIARHLPHGDGDQHPRNRQRRRDREWRSLLDQLLLTDPIYAAAYQRANDLLTRAEALTEDAIHLATKKLSSAEAALDALLKRASRLPDGTRVFRDQNGQVYDEHGRLVPSDKIDSIVWRPENPSYEAFRQSQEEVNDAQAELNALLSYQIDVLGHWRNKMEDADNPPSLDDLETLEGDLLGRAHSALRPQLSSAFAEFERTTAGEKNVESKSQAEVFPPKLTHRSKDIDIPKL